MDLNLESLVFSRIKTSVSKALITKYKDLNFSTSNRARSNTKYPMVYIHMLESPEVASTTEGDTVEGVLASFQIDVYDDQSQERTKDVADEVLKAVKNMRFQVIGFPYNSNTDSIYRKIIRIRRNICDDDIL